jgi:hypothetical protein
MVAITSSLPTPTPSQLTKSLEKSEPAVETQSDADKDDNTTTPNGMVNLSPAAIKLSSSTPVQSSDKTAPIENKDQAQQALNQLIADFQSNPSQAHGAHSTLFSESVKSLLG